MSDVWVCEQTLVAAENRWTTACGYRTVPEPDQSWVVDLLTNGWFITGAYVAIGLVLGRVALTVVNRKHDTHEEDHIGIGFAALFWPLAIFVAVGWWFISGGMRRDERAVAERRARATQLRADAREWDDKRRTGTDAEREMAAQLAKLCREQADELEAAR